MAENNDKTEIIKPAYYDAFSCIAAECSFTCCQEWDIEVDPNTQTRWSRVGIKPEKYVHETNGCDCITLNKDKKCPLLSAEGLCSLVLKYGEGMISKTCHTYPREKKEYMGGERTEYNLAIGCPEVLRFLWNEDIFLPDAAEDMKEPENMDALMRLIRKNICLLMQDKSYSLQNSIKMAFFILLDLRKNKKGLTSAYINNCFTAKTLNELKNAIEGIPEDIYGGITEQNELFLDLSESYVKKGMYESLLKSLVSKAAEYEDVSLKKEFLKKRTDFEEKWKAYDKQMRLLLSEEIYAGLYVPKGDIYRAVIKMQWIGLFFAALKQALFLSWDIYGKDFEERAMETVVLMARMAGYSEDDITEYLNNNFESELWDWNYMALIIK